MRHPPAAPQSSPARIARPHVRKGWLDPPARCAAARRRAVRAGVVDTALGSCPESCGASPGTTGRSGVRRLRLLCQRGSVPPRAEQVHTGSSSTVLGGYVGATSTATPRHLMCCSLRDRPYVNVLQTHCHCQVGDRGAQLNWWWAFGDCPPNNPRCLLRRGCPAPCPPG